MIPVRAALRSWNATYACTTNWNRVGDRAVADGIHGPMPPTPTRIKGEGTDSIWVLLDKTQEKLKKNNNEESAVRDFKKTSQSANNHNFWIRHCIDCKTFSSALLALGRR